MPYSPELQKVIDSYSNLYMPDKIALFIALASVAGSKFEGEPIHMFLIGPPSSGKNIILESLLGLPKTYHLTTFNESALLSASSKKDRSAASTGGLLKTIGQGGEGIFVFSEFNNVLAMHPDTRRETLAALHQVCSGMYDRARGTDGGLSLSWRGKVQVLAGCTQQVEEHMPNLSKVGERFLYCRMPDLDRKQQARAAAENARNGSYMKYKKLREEVTADFFKNLVLPHAPEDLIDQSDEDILIAMADFATLARSPVPRNEKREIEFAHDAEYPARMYMALQRLLCGLRLIGVPTDDSIRLVARMALSSMPGMRKTALKVLASKIENGDTVTVQDIRTEVPFYGETTIRRAMEELEVHGIVEKYNGHTNMWAFSEGALENWVTAFRIEDLE